VQSNLLAPARKITMLLAVSLGLAFAVLVVWDIAAAGDN
jgi:hypothetical protein